jgi:hypothetical protein
VRGLPTFQFGLNDIHVASRGNIVEGNLIGLTPGQTAATSKGRAGVRISGVGANTIGGTAPASRNVISGKSYGVVVAGGAAAGNRILGNFIGTNGIATGRIDNVKDGVLVSNAPNTVIGGPTAGARNILSGNGASGLSISGSNATGTQVLGNFIGVNAAGTGGLGNAQGGVLIDFAPNTVVGGSAAGARNIIAANGLHGVLVRRVRRDRDRQCHPRQFNLPEPGPRDRPRPGWRDAERCRRRRRGRE